MLGNSTRTPLVAAIAVVAVAVAGVAREPASGPSEQPVAAAVFPDDRSSASSPASLNTGGADLTPARRSGATSAPGAEGSVATVTVTLPTPGATANPTVAPPTPGVPHTGFEGDDAWQHHGLVAHAFGSTLDRTTYTNSEEAIRLSHGYGFRVFEVDMMLLRDKQVALVHDGFEGRYGLSRKKTFSGYTRAELEGKRFDGKYPMLFGDDLIRLMTAFQDSYVVLDTKGEHVEIARWFVRHMRPSMLDRLRPHVHSQEQIDGLRSIYDWKGMIIATYKMGTGVHAQALELAAVNGINTVMIRGSHYSDAMRKDLAAGGVEHVFIHDAKNEAEARKWRAMGLGVYSHYWTWT